MELNGEERSHTKDMESGMKDSNICDEVNMDTSAVPLTNEMKAEDSLTSPKPKKRRRSSAVIPSPLGDSPDTTSRYGRTRKPKVSYPICSLPSLCTLSIKNYTLNYFNLFCFQHDSEDFLPTDAVLGKSSPKKGKLPTETLIERTPLKGRKSLSLLTPLSTKSQELKDFNDHSNSMKGSIDTKIKSEENSDLLNGLKIPPVEETNGTHEDIVTEFEPGDLIWGRLGHHPFWPCIVINDPVDHIYFKKGECEEYVLEGCKWIKCKLSFFFPFAVFFLVQIFF